MNNYRHGDLGLFEINELPEGLKKSTSKTLMTGSGGHNHTFDHGEFYTKQNGLVVGYLVAKNTSLYHPEHGQEMPKSYQQRYGNVKRAKISDGVYELRKQQEDTHDGMKPVID